MTDKQNNSIENIMELYKFDAAEKEFMNYSKQAQTNIINHSQILTKFMLIKQLRSSTEQIINSNAELSEQLKTSTEKFIKSNMALSDAQNNQSQKMVWLTCALVGVGVLQVVVPIIIHFFRL